jgi:NADPH:quinone reductase
MSSVIQRPAANEQQQMDAVVIQASGPPAESLAVRSEPVPEPAPGEVLVEVHAAAVNPLDVANVQGFLGTPLPMIPGVDFAGVVVSDGDHDGEEVWGSAPQLGMTRPGTHARFVALPETWLSRKPERLTMTEAAAVGRPYLAAWETIIEAGELKPGETIVITGGAGLVGQAATAIARWRGATPIIADRRRPDGVEHFIDISSSDLREAVHVLTDGRGADMVLDTVGGTLFESALTSLRFGGRLTGLHSHERVEFDPVEIYSYERHVTGLASVFMNGGHCANIFDQLRALFDRGVLAPPVINTWPLADSAEAYQTVLDGPHGIKQVLLIGGEA